MNATITVQKEKEISIKELISTWMNKKNVFYSRIAGENISNREVLYCNIICINLLCAAITVENMPLLSLLNALIATAALLKLNRKN